MNSKVITIASLNLWNFNEWERRLPLIISTIQKANPDIIFFQEVQKDINFNMKNQLGILNESLKYPFSQFSLSGIKTKRKGVILPFPVDHGLGILSKFPFKSESISLTRSTEKSGNAILQIGNFEIDNKKHCFTNVHFLNSDASAEENFKESLTILKDKDSTLIGDFNIKDIKKYKNLYIDKYTSSSDFTDYVSYPMDEVSYDYILLSNKYKFKNFECLDENISDHKMIVTTINLG